MKITAAQVSGALTKANDAMTILGTVVPQAMIAYNMFKVIWLMSNPGKTEEDYLTMLTTASQANIDQSSAILLADGYVEDAQGNWSKPAGAAKPASA